MYEVYKITIIIYLKKTMEGDEPGCKISLIFPQNNAKTCFLKENFHEMKLEPPKYQFLSISVIKFLLNIFPI